MPSLFSRARTTSTPNKKAAADLGGLDEFGRVNSRGSTRQAIQQQYSASTKKAGAKKDAGKTKSKTLPPGADDEAEFALPDGTFLPLNLEKPRYERAPGEPVQEQPQGHDYGYLSFSRHVVLGLAEVARLVDVVGDELATRGLTTPFIFSTLGLDISSSAVRRLIQAFLRTCGKQSSESERQWREEARLAGPHELGMCLRWGLARVVRYVGGQETRGLVSYDAYMEWRDAEAAMNYPEMHFSTFVEPLEPLLQPLLAGLFSLLSRFTAHSATSGHTPPTLSPLFGPLLFGLGPSTANFHHAYLHYLRAATATEHLILSFIRYQDAKTRASAPTLGVPTRLKAWIQGYPSMLPTMGKDERPQPRRGARTIRVLSVRRNVRMYSPDLVKSAASWAHRPRGAVSPAGERAFSGSKEWERIAPPTLKLPPRYSDNYKKRMDLPPNFNPDTGAGSAASTLTPPSLTSSISSASSVGSSNFFDDQDSGLSEDRFRSLTDLKWGEFEAMGFGSPVANEQKLQFDLTEGARAARAAKRATLNWQDFSSSGFSRTDAHLSATLQFSPPVANTITQWPSHSAEMHRKLKKTQKALPPFGWDTEPVVGGEEVIEEPFVDVFCDLIYGGGWMDGERCEDTDRECNWALVEFKSIPVARTNTVSGTNDPRTSATLILFEEFVPYEYRQQLSGGGPTRRRLPSLFSRPQPKWKVAPTLNGRPYVVGYVPHSPNYREVEFEGLLRSNGSATKVLSLHGRPPASNPMKAGHTLSPSSAVATPGHELNANPLIKVTSAQAALTPLRTATPVSSPTAAREDGNGSPLANAFKKSTRFRMAGLPSSPAAGRTAGLMPTEYDPVEFDTRIASFDDDELRSKSGTPSRLMKHARRHSKDDAWVDILVATNNRRFVGQDAEPRNGISGGRSDPELASQEVSEALAGIRGRFPEDDDDDDGMEPVPGPSGDAGDTSTLQESMIDRTSTNYGDDDVDDHPPIPTRSKRMGYFDLHPDRRPPTLVDDPRDSFARSSYESDADDDNPYSAATVKTRQLPTNNVPSQYRESVASMYDDEEQEPPPPKPSPKPSPKPTSQNPLPSATVVSTDGSAKANLSKTASLIEMYREKERTTSPTPIPSSRLPVRAASLQPPATPAKDRSGSPLLRTPSPSRPTALPETVEPAAVAEPKVSVEDVEIDLPTRYIHGAPLHNVLEEEEEE